MFKKIVMAFRGKSIKPEPPVPSGNIFLSQEEIPSKDAAHFFKEPLDFKILLQQFELKTRPINSNLTQIRNTMNNSNLETILKEMEKEGESVNASSIASQYLV